MKDLNTSGLKWKNRIFFCCLAFMAATFFHVKAANPSLLIDADAQYDFAFKLFQQEAYIDAASEFKRFTHFFPDDPRAPEATTYIGKAYFNSGNYNQAINAFRNLTEHYAESRAAYRAFFYISDCYLKLKEPHQAIISLQNLITLTDDPELVNEAFYRMGWIALDAGVFADAARAFDQTSLPFRNEKRIDELLSAVKNRNHLRFKNPKIAGMLSIVPGAGQLYCGRYKDALSAFIINTGLILAAVESFENDLYALGGTISFFEFGFYSGNIYGAVASAHKHNTSETRRFVQNLRDKYRVGLLSLPKKNGIMLSFQYLY